MCETSKKDQQETLEAETWYCDVFGLSINHSVFEMTCERVNHSRQTGGLTSLVTVKLMRLVAMQTSGR